MKNARTLSFLLTVVTAVVFNLAALAFGSNANATPSVTSGHDGGHVGSGHDGGHVGSGHDGGH